MTKLIITPDDHSHKKEIYTFLIYDLKCKKIEYIKEKVNELDCLDLLYQGRSTFRPFGIDYDDKYIYIVSNNKLGVFDKYNYEFITLLDIPLFINTHQIIKNKDTFYICNTAVDTIGIYNKEIKHLSLDNFDVVNNVYKPNHAESNDNSHVNSLYFHDNYIYFCLHNNNKKMSRYGRFDKNTLKVEIIGDAGYCSHGIVILNNKLYSLSSGTGDIIEIDLKTKQINYYPFVDPEIIFLRGIDIYNENILLGCSNNHNNRAKQENCFISLFDPITKTIIRYLDINEAFVITDLKLMV